MPDVIHAVAIKPIIYSAIASRICMLESRVYAFGGLGYIFSSKTKKSKIFKNISVFLLRILMRGKKTIIILQNRDDYDILKSYKIVNKNNTRIIRGAGVDTQLFSPKKQKSANIPIVLLPARMLWDKCE